MFLVFRALKEPKYLLLAAIFAVLILFIYPFLQVLPQGLNNFWFWFTLLTPLTWALYLFWGVLFGTTLSFIIWQKAKKICPPRQTTASGIFGFAGGLLGTLAPVCAACISLPALILPFGAFLLLVKYSLEIMIFSVVLLLSTLWFFGGFSKT